MDNKFYRLLAEYEKAVRDDNQQLQEEELIKKMRENLMQRNEGKEEYTSSKGEKYNISLASKQELLQINNDLSRVEAQRSKDITAATERAIQMSRNKYSPENPYLGE